MIKKKSLGFHKLLIGNKDYGLITLSITQEDFSPGDLKTQLMDREEDLFSFFVLGKMLAKAGDDKELHSYLVSKANELVFSDSERLSASNASFFTPFFIHTSLCKVGGNRF